MLPYRIDEVSTQKTSARPPRYSHLAIITFHESNRDGRGIGQHQPLRFVGEHTVEGDSRPLGGLPIHTDLVDDAALHQFF
jgi:hypothetical protein